MHHRWEGLISKVTEIQLYYTMIFCYWGCESKHVTQLELQIVSMSCAFVNKYCLLHLVCVSYVCMMSQENIIYPSWKSNATHNVTFYWNKSVFARVVFPSSLSVAHHLTELSFNSKIHTFFGISKKCLNLTVCSNIFPLRPFCEPERLCKCQACLLRPTCVCLRERGREREAKRANKALPKSERRSSAGGNRKLDEQWWVRGGQVQWKLKGTKTLTYVFAWVINISYIVWYQTIRACGLILYVH